jgi:hypothetical protein
VPMEIEFVWLCPMPRVIGVRVLGETLIENGSSVAVTLTVVTAPVSNVSVIVPVFVPDASALEFIETESNVGLAEADEAVGDTVTQGGIPVTLKACVDPSLLVNESVFGCVVRP